MRSNRKLGCVHVSPAQASKTANATPYMGVPHAKWLTSRRAFSLAVTAESSGNDEVVLPAPFQKEARPGSDGRIAVRLQAKSVAAAFEYV
jgi:hypothetical protein